MVNQKNEGLMKLLKDKHDQELAIVNQENEDLKKLVTEMEQDNFKDTIEASTQTP